MTFNGETDVSELDLDAIISINERAIVVYPDDFENKPSVGNKLNKPSTITIYDSFPRHKNGGFVTNIDALKKRKWKDKLQNMADRKLVNYDYNTGM